MNASTSTEERIVGSEDECGINTASKGLSMSAVMSVVRIVTIFSTQI